MPFSGQLLKRLTAVFLILGGVALFLTGGWFTLVHADFLRDTERAEGIVTEVVDKRGARGMTLYHPVVSYRPLEGAGGIVFTAKPGFWPSPFDTGDRVTVAYRANDPDDAKIVSFWMLWFLPGAMMLLGAGCLLAGQDTWVKAA